MLLNLNKATLPFVFGDNNWLQKLGIYRSNGHTLCSCSAFKNLLSFDAGNRDALQKKLMFEAKGNWCVFMWMSKWATGKSSNKSLLKIRGYQQIHPELTVLEPDWRQCLLMLPKLQELPIRRPLNNEEIIYWGIHKVKWPVA